MEESLPLEHCILTVGTSQCQNTLISGSNQLFATTEWQYLYHVPLTEINNQLLSSRGVNTLIKMYLVTAGLARFR